MSYNWQKIFKRKSEMELYKIYTGETQLNSEAIKFAKKELQNRNFDFNTIDEFKYQSDKKIEEDKEKENIENLKYGIKNPSRYILIIFFGLCILLLVKSVFTVEYISPFSNNSDLQTFSFSTPLGLILIIIGIIGLLRNQYRKKKKMKAMK